MDPKFSLDPDDYEDVDIDDPDNPELTEEDFARAAVQGGLSGYV